MKDIGKKINFMVKEFFTMKTQSQSILIIVIWIKLRSKIVQIF